ncbi:MAG: leucine-rich repeat domain-containing protein, partial [Muribaculaceae bacterium]|nr:leucine-rich repeat domain-containing protein [Muribaculaceae bacterium]
MKKLSLIILGALLSLPVFARDFKYTYKGQTITYTIVNQAIKTCTTKCGEGDGYNGYSGNDVSGELEIPAIASDGMYEYSVIAIGECSFKNCNGLTSVTIPSSVKSIGDYAFYGCSLSSIDIPDATTSIGNFTFCGCRELASVTIPTSVTSIGEHTFAGCVRLTSVIIPNSVVHIGNGAFFDCRLNS